MDRPLFQKRIDELEAIVVAAESLESLETVAGELAFRTTSRARRLNGEVARILGLLRWRGPIFRDPERELRSDETIAHLDEYRSKRRHFGLGLGNDSYPEESRRVLNVKQGRLVDIAFFAGRIAELLLPRVTVAVVPSSDPANAESGTVRLARLLTAVSGGSDASRAVIRTARKEPAHFGGDRSMQRQLETMSVLDPSLVAGRSVLLIDDVTTSGNSLRAARQRLVEVGAHRVKMLALGQTSWR